MAATQPASTTSTAPVGTQRRDRALVWVTDILTSPVGLALTMAVLFYYQLETMALRPNFIKALAYFANDAEMQFKLGAFYYHGMEGLTEDQDKAQAWFTAAAENGHGDAALHLGYMHYKGYGTNTSKEASHKWLAASAKKNNTEAAYRLGYLYYTGEGVGRNYQLAARQFRSAAERQHAGAAAMLGYMYHKGRGLPTHNKLAMLWFRRAAEMGDSHAMVNLGVMNFRGKGTRKDFVLAYMWFGLAHQLGDQETSYNGLDYMNRLVAKGKISPEEIVEAVDLGQEWAEKHGLTDQQHGGYQSNPPTTLPPGTRIRSRSGGNAGGDGAGGGGAGEVLRLDPEEGDGGD